MGTEAFRQTERLRWDVTKNFGLLTNTKGVPASPDPVLELACFVKPPRICFENVKIGSTKVKVLKIFNPGEEIESIVLEKYPDPELGFSIEGLHSAQQLHLQPKEEVEIKISWQPIIPGSSRHLVTFRWIGGQKLQLVILASAQDPNAGKKKRARRIPGKRALYPSHRLNIPQEKLQAVKKNELMTHGQKARGYESPNVKKLVDVAPDTPSRRSTFTVAQSTFEKKDVSEVYCDEKENASVLPDDHVTRSTFSVENVASDVDVKDAQNAIATTGHEDKKLDPKMASFEGKIFGENPDSDQSVEGNTFHESEIRLSSSPIKWCVGYEYFASSTYKRELHPGQVVLNGEVKHGFIPYPSFDNTDTFLNMEMSTTGKHKASLEDESLSFDSAASSLFTITREEKFYPNLEPVKESNDALATPKAFPSESKTLTNDTDTATPMPSENGTWINEVRESSDCSFSIAREDKFVPNLEPLKEIAETPKASQSRTLTNETYGATPLPVGQCTWEGEVKSVLVEDAVSQRFSGKADDISSKDDMTRSVTNMSKPDITPIPCHINSTASSETPCSSNVPLRFEIEGCRTPQGSAASVIHTKQDEQGVDNKSAAMPANELTIVGKQAVNIELIDGKQFENVLTSEKHDLVDSVPDNNTKGASAVLRNTSKSKISVPRCNGLKQSEHSKKTEGTRTVQSRYMSSKSKCKDLPAGKQNKEMIKAQPRKEMDIIDAKFKGINLPQKRRNEAVISAGKTVKPSVAIKKLKLVKSQEKIARHPMPYAAKNMFYDERWIEKQERGFKNWLNFVLTPPDDDAETRNDIKRGTVCLETGSNQPVAPTKEMLSFKMYAAKRRMAKLRRDACMLYQTDQFASVIHKIEREIEHGRLAIRIDRHVDADLGVRKHIADMLLSFNPLWLRIGLEVVYGEIIPINSNNDASGLSRFIHRRLLGNPDIAAEYSHPSVPGLYKPGYVETLGKFTLKKLLLVIIYLDKAKNSRLISHDPCLFDKDSQFKSIREMLLMFSRDYLHREGDIVKHLTYLGYTVSHVQTPLHEYDFGVSSLAVDLRDGLRLVRVVELLTQNWSLSPRLRVPAVSRLQKIHNVELAFQGLTESRLDVKKESNIDARFIVDGHREKTLSLLWKIIFHFQVDLLLDEGKLKDEIKYLERKITLMNDYSEFRQNISLKLTEDDLFENSPYNKWEKLGLLLKWCYLIGKLHGARVENFTVSFSDGRALCYLLNHYHPCLLKKEEIRDETTITCSASQGDSDDETDNFLAFQNSKSNSYYSRTGANAMQDTLLANEKHNLNVFCEKVKEIGASPAMVLASDMSNTIPDEKVVIAYLSFLCSRLLDLREEIRAARCIQMAWRQHHLQDRKKERQVLVKAVTKIQAIARGFLARRRLQKKTDAVKLLQKNVRSFLSKKMQYKRECAATTIQQHYKALKQMRLARKSYLEKREAAVRLQRAYRKTLQIRYGERQKAACHIQVAWKNYRIRKLRSKENEAALIVQKNWRGYVNRKRFLLVRSAALVLQRTFRAYIKKRLVREDFLNKRRAAITLQSCWRRAVVRKETVMTQACIVIQACFRRHRCRVAYLELRGAVIKIQSNVRTHQCQSRYNNLKRAVVYLQCTRRSLVTTRNARDAFRNTKAACITIQKIYRGRVAQRDFRRMKASVIKLQAAWRGKVCRQKIMLMKLAASRIQNTFRAWKVMCATRQEFIELRDGTLAIQSAFRGHRQRKKFLAIRNATIKVQTLLRGKICRDKFLALKAASITIQRQYRAAALRRTTRIEYQQIRKSSIKIQAWYRGRKSRELFVNMKRAVIRLQSSYRRLAAVRRFKQVKNAALVIQQRYRAVKLCQATQVHFLITKAAVIKIQSLYKGYACRKNLTKRRSAAVLIQATYRGHVVRKRTQRKVAAATKIQSLWRRCLKRSEYKVLREATVVIQRNARRYFELRKYQDIRGAVIKIQRFYRGYLQMKAAIDKYQQERAALIKIQAMSRGFLSRRLLQKHKAARKLQAVTRGYLQRKRYLELVSIVLKIQAITRSKIECRRRMDAALCIQQRWKAVYYGRAQRARHLMARRACIVIQSFVRRWIKLRCFARLRSATVVIQRRFRAHCLMQEKQREYQCMKNSAVVIQSVYRMHLARKQFSDKKTAVILLQKQVRTLIAQRKFHREVHAANAIQQWYKACREMQERRSSFSKKKQAAILLQAQQRGLVVRRRFALMRNAAVKIQAWYRMRTAKRSYIEKRNAVLTIQRRYRAFVACQMQQLCFHLMRGAAITIQASIRGFLARRDFIRARRSAVCLQASWRRYICEKRYRSLQKLVVNLQRKVRANALARVEKRGFIKKRAVAIRIQRKLREYLVLKRAAIMVQAQFRMLCDRRRFILMRSSCVKIQRCFRAYAERKSAVIVLQSFWRMYVARKAYHRKISACIRIQSAVKGFIVKRSYMLCLGAVLVIQMRYRAFVEGLSVRDRFVKMRRSCVLLQACLRRWTTRRSFVSLRQKAIVLQRRYRAQVAMKNERRKFIELKSATVKIQGVCRIYLAKVLAENLREEKRIEEALKRAREQQIMLEKHNAATMIQKHFKAFKRRNDYLEWKENAIKIQRFYRSRLLSLKARNEYLVKYQSVVMIQRVYRIYIARKRLQMLRRRKEKLNAAATCIQSIFRCLIERKLFLKKKDAVNIIQRHFRGHLLTKKIRSQYLLQRSSAITIQFAYRSFAAKSLLRSLQQRRNMELHAATLIQKTTRGFLCRRIYRQLRSAIVVIQRRYRSTRTMMIVRDQYIETRNAALKIQRSYRAYLATKAITRRIAEKKRRIESALTIQRSFRNYKFISSLRAELCLRRAAAIKIQRCFRAYVAKKQMLKFRAALKIQHAYRNYKKEQNAIREISATKIQASFRGYIQRRYYQKLKAVTMTLQSKVRKILQKRRSVRQNSAAIVIQHWYRSVSQLRRDMASYKEARKAAIYIQSIWRGFLVRKDIVDRKTIRARERIASANQEATEPRKLCNRTKSALSYLLNCKNVSTIYEALKDLEVSTRLSTKCCERLIQDDALPVIFQIIRNCNRSLPSIEQIHMALLVLTNIAKCQTTYMAIIRENDSLQLLMELMANFREKRKVFPNCCILISILCNDYAIVQLIQESSILSRKLQALNSLIYRKAQIELKRTNGRVKLRKDDKKDPLSIMEQMSSITDLVNIVNQS